MADNTTLNLGTGGDNISTDDLGAVKVQRVKVQIGTDGSASDVNTSNPLPVSDAGGALSVDDNGSSLTVDSAQLPSALVGGRFDVNIGAGSVGVTGTVTVDTELPAAGALADGASNPTTPTVGAANHLFNGTTWDRVRGDTTNGLDVDVTRLPALPAGSNNIGDVDVLTLPALPAGSNNIGDVDVLTLPALPAGNNNIGDVDVVSVVPGTGATALGKAEDAAHTTGDVGVMALAVRNDAGTTLAGTDLDYAPLSLDSSGALRVTGGTGGTAIADDAGFSVGSTNVTPAAGIYRSSRDAVDNNDVGAFAMTQTRAQYVSPETPLGDSMADDTLDALKVVTYDVEHISTGSITANAQEILSPDLQEGACIIEIDGTFSGTINFYILTGAQWRLVGGYQVGLGGIAPANGTTDVAGSWWIPCAGAQRVRARSTAWTSGTANVTITGSSAAFSPQYMTVAFSGTQTVQGVAATDAPVSGNPLLAGARAATTPPSAVSADGDAVPLRSTRKGELCVLICDSTGDSCADDSNESIRVTVAANTLDPTLVDDGAFTLGTSRVTPVAGNYNSTRDLVNDGDVGAFAMTQRRAQLCVLETVSGDALADDTADTLKISGAIAHDSAVAGSPILNGFEARTSDGTAVGNGDAVRAMASTLGKLVVLNGSILANQTQGNLNRTNTTAADVIAAAGAGVKIAVMSITVTNRHATQGTDVTIRDGTTAKWGPQYAAPAGGGFAPNGGAFPLFVTTANTAVTAICSDSANTNITVTGYLTTE